MTNPVIKTLRNGPILMKGLKDSFYGPSGEKTECGDTAAICRCGASGKKPFCDNTHVESGFKSEKLPVRKKDRVVDYPGEGITINDNRGVCSHDGSCFRELPEVFRPKEWRWIKAREASAEKIIETVKKCPSGALSYTVEGVRHQDIQRPPAVKTDPHGPLNAEGYIKLDDCGGAHPESAEHYSLCTCRKSRNKPFCDGSHAPGVFKFEETE